MKVEIKRKEKNPLMHRTEVEFAVENSEKTPSRRELREKLSALLDAKPENLIVGEIIHEFGTMQVSGKASLYESPQILERLELKKFKAKNFPEKFGKKEERLEEKE